MLAASCTCCAYCAASCAATAFTQAWRTVLICATRSMLNCNCTCCTARAAMSWRWGKVRTSSKPKLMRRAISVSSSRLDHSSPNRGLAMRPCCAACDASATACANKACQAGLLCQARPTASACCKGCSSRRCAALLRCATCSAVVANCSGALLNGARSCWLGANSLAGSTLAQPASTATNSSAQATLATRCFMVTPLRELRPWLAAPFRVHRHASRRCAQPRHWPGANRPPHRRARAGSWPRPRCKRVTGSLRTARPAQALAVLAMPACQTGYQAARKWLARRQYMPRHKSHWLALLRRFARYWLAPRQVG